MSKGRIYRLCAAIMRFSVRRFRPTNNTTARYDVTVQLQYFSCTSFIQGPSPSDVFASRCIAGGGGGGGGASRPCLRKCTRVFSSESVGFPYRGGGGFFPPPLGYRERITRLVFRYSVWPFFLSQVKRMDAEAYRQKLELFGPAVLSIDCRSFVCFNVSHVRGAVNVNVADRINRRRLQTRKATLVELAYNRDAKDALKRRGYREIVVYDDSTVDLDRVPHNHPLMLILASLVDDEREPSFLIGELSLRRLLKTVRIIAENTINAWQRRSGRDSLRPVNPEPH